MTKQLLSKKPSVLKLVAKHKQFAGRCSQTGRTTVLGRGGGVKKRYRVVDFRRSLWNVTGSVQSLEYDPFRRCYIALVCYPLAGAKSVCYILAPEGLNIGDKIFSSDIAPPRLGNSFLLSNIPFNLKIHNIESYPSSGGRYVRAAGGWAKIVEKAKNSVVIQFRNGVKKILPGACCATIGSVSNYLARTRTLHSAGLSRLLGFRPKVRGVAKNPVDHPHGGGNGKKSGCKVSKSPWRKLGKGTPTVKHKNHWLPKQK